MSVRFKAFLLVTVFSAAASPALGQEMRTERVVVEGDRLAATSAIAGLDLSLRETPQSVTVVSRRQMDDSPTSTTCLIWCRV
jgi:outer membrane receptor for ferric coprogen and ferric-rhodotorulic acid